MLSIGRVVCVVIMLTSVGIADDHPDHVLLTPPEEYEKIPTRREAESTRAAMSTSVESGRQRSRNRGNRSQSVVRDRQLDGMVTSSLQAEPQAKSSSEVQPTPQTAAEDELPRLPPVMMSIPVAEASKDVAAKRAVSDFDGPEAVDLRRFLPVPKQQGKHNCIAWAIGYANYSCQVCQERRTTVKPTKNHEIFSPSYIYNKINGGRDIGLHANEAVDFMSLHGCATLQTMPLDRLAPNATAEHEAGLYRSWAHEKAVNVEDIRYYLQHGYPVILVIRNNAEFNRKAKIDQPYLWNKTADEMEADIEDFGKHAVCAVGYDDQKEAVLVMNSSGTDWKDGGFCWVDYKSLDNIPRVPADDHEGWCFEAHVIKVKDDTPVVTVVDDLGEVTFQLKEDGMVYDGNIRRSPDVSTSKDWNVVDLTCNHETLFLMRSDRMVVRLRNYDDVVDGIDMPIWSHLTSGLPADAKPSMIGAAIDTPLYAITNTGELLRMPSEDSYSWERVDIQGADQSKFVDLRDNRSDGPLTVTTDQGEVFKFDKDEGWIRL